MTCSGLFRSPRIGDVCGLFYPSVLLASNCERAPQGAEGSSPHVPELVPRAHSYGESSFCKAQQPFDKDPQKSLDAPLERKLGQGSNIVWSLRARGLRGRATSLFCEMAFGCRKSFPTGLTPSLHYHVGNGGWVQGGKVLGNSRILQEY